MIAIRNDLIAKCVIQILWWMIKHLVTDSKAFVIGFIHIVDCALIQIFFISQSSGIKVVVIKTVFSSEDVILIFSLIIWNLCVLSIALSIAPIFKSLLVLAWTVALSSIVCFYSKDLKVLLEEGSTIKWRSYNRTLIYPKVLKQAKNTTSKLN